MAQLLVRDLPEAVVRSLKLRAARHGQSTEAEHRRILEEALLRKRPRRTLKEWRLAMPAGGTDADFARSRGRGHRGRRVDL